VGRTFKWESVWAKPVSKFTIIQTQCLPVCHIVEQSCSRRWKSRGSIFTGSGYDICRFLISGFMHFVTTLTISSHDGGNDCRSVDLYINQCPDLYIKNAISAPLSSPYSWAFLIRVRFLRREFSPLRFRVRDIVVWGKRICLGRRCLIYFQEAQV
jgi:hypothetical protein